MKTIALALLFTASIFIHEVANYKINFEKTEIGFYFPADKLNGTINGFKGEIHFDITDLEDSHIEGTVDVSKLDTKNEGRDAHLKNADYFDIEKFPTMGFKSTHMEKKENGILVTGNMTIKGESHEENIMMEYKDGMFIGETTIFLTNYGMNISKKEEKNQVDITFRIPATAE